MIPQAPLLDYAGATGTSGTVGVAMTVAPTLLNANGAFITNCEISPSLTLGLSINTTTCVISGTPTGILSSTPFSVRAVNSVGSSAPVTVTLAASVAAPTLSYAGATGTAGQIGLPMSVSPTTLSTNGAAISSCTIAPSLPTGLSLNDTTCVISGTPTVALLSTTYSVTATNSAGPAFASVTLAVGTAVPTLSYSSATGTLGTPGVPMSVSPTTLNTNGAAITSCTVTPSLPAGLSLHNTTCVISGTPSGILPSTPYTVTATNSAGPSSASVTLTVSAAAPTLNYNGATGTSGSINVPMSVSPTILLNNGATITSCAVTPSLPAGLSLHNTTCVISGTLPSALAPTIYYVTATNSAGSSSSAPVTLTVNGCPQNYALVPANTSLGVVNDFCVARFEMKNVSGTATSQAASTPWVSINRSDAKNKCTDLGIKYDLISNPEWMTIARNIENTDSNWSGSYVGIGMLNRGHSDNSPGTARAVTTTTDPYTATGNNSGQVAGAGWEQKRTHALSNGQEIWDFAGNVWELTDWSPSPELQLGPTTCPGGGAVELPGVSCGALSAHDFMPANPSAVSAAIYNSNYGLGKLSGGSGGNPYRGGGWSASSSAGVFSLNLGSSHGASSTSVGFRCVYRP